jgi:hypothetical protein
MTITSKTSFFTLLYLIDLLCCRMEWRVSWGAFYNRLVVNERGKNGEFVSTELTFLIGRSFFVHHFGVILACLWHICHQQIVCHARPKIILDHSNRLRQRFNYVDSHSFSFLRLMSWEYRLAFIASPHINELIDNNLKYLPTH